MRRVLLVIFIACVCNHLYSQTDLPNNPPSLRWYQVNTPHFRVLFPKGFDTQAMRVANTLETIRSAEAKSLGTEPRKISVILQNQSAISNGFVSVLPRRSEFYGMPPQNYNFAGTNDWLNMLMSHEYRHVVQYQHAVRGFNKAFLYLFGYPTMAGMAQAAAPGWFWEGDAVVTETAFTPSGRGKIPAFSLAFRTNLLEGRTFNYHKQYLQSYKNFIPDEYVLGFHMVSYLRKRTNDPEIWGKITARSWSVPFIPFAFSNAIRKETGLYVTQLYREMAKDFKKQWQAELATLTLTPFERINFRRSKSYTDYRYPQVLEDGSILAVKSGIGTIATYVKIKDGKEKKVFIPGIINESGMLSVADDLIVWNEYGYDPRWQMRSYSLVKSYDMKKKKRKRISNVHGREAAAAISKDKKIVTIETTTAYETKVIVRDHDNGKILKEFSNPQNYFYSMPRWSADGKKIVMLKTTNGGKTISIADYDSGEISDLLPVANENLGYPVLYGDYVLFNSPASGIDNIYAIKLETGERFQVTTSRYGAYNPAISLDGKFIYYNDQSRDGLDIVRTAFAPETWTKFDKQQTAPNLYEHLVEQEGDQHLFSNVPANNYPVQKYSKLKGLINLYAWGLNVETDLTQASVGIASRNILSTTTLSAGYTFDLNERTGAWRAAASYQGLFPILDVSVSMSNRRANEGTWYFQKKNGNDTIIVSDKLEFKWKEMTVEGGVRIPLNLTNGRFVTHLSVGNNLGYLHVSDFTNSINGAGRQVPYLLNRPYPFLDYVENGNLVYNHFSLTFTRLRKQSWRDINSKWAQALYINSYQTPFGGNFKANQFSGYAVLYFPGLFRHHSIWGYGGYQYTQFPTTPEEEDMYYLFRNRIPVPRGVSIVRTQNLYTTAINYTLPLWYPDIAIGPLLNIQRFRGNGFVDYAQARHPNGFGEDYMSTGFELRADINILRFYPQFDIGIRFSQVLQPQKTYAFDVLIGTFNF